MKVMFATVLLGLLAGCAQLHHVQVGEVHSPQGYVQKPFEIRVSEMGFDAGRAASVVKGASTRSGGGNNDAGKALAILALFQMGPRTGMPVYDKNYAKDLIQVVYEKCPSGRVTGLMSIRETRDYSVISGEIIKIKGYCMLPKGVTK